MSLNTVTLICDLYDGQQNAITTGQISFTPNATVLDATDHVVLTRAPIIIPLLRNPLPQVTLIACDNTGLQPSNWAYLFEATFNGHPASALYQVEFASGATQYLSQLLPSASVPAVYPGVAVTNSPSSGQYLRATGPSSADWETVSLGTGTVTGVTAADTSVVIGGTSAAPTVRTNTLDVIATQHPPAASVPMNSKKISGLANGTVSTDAAAFGQMPAALPPNGSAGGDLAGSTYPNPVVAKIQGTAVASPPGGTTQFLRGDGTWAVPAGSGGGGGATIDTASVDIQALGTRAAGSIGLAADSGHVHPVTGLQTAAISATTADFQPLGTAAAGSTGRLADAGHVHPPAGVAVIDSTATDIQPLGTRAAGSVGKAADAGHVHPIAGLLDTTSTDIAALGTRAAGAVGLAADAGHVHPLTGVLPLAGGTLTGWLAPAVATLTQSGGTVAVNAALGNVFTLTLTASTWTISNPTSPVDGQVIRFRLTQDATGSRSVSWGTAYDWGTGNTAPALSGTASKVDILGFEYVASLSKWCSLGASFPQAF